MASLIVTPFSIPHPICCQFDSGGCTPRFFYKFTGALSYNTL